MVIIINFENILKFVNSNAILSTTFSAKKLKGETNRIFKHGKLKKSIKAERPSPMFIIFKPDGYIRAPADLKELDKQINAMHL